MLGSDEFRLFDMPFDMPVFLESFWLFIYLMIYIVSVSVVFGIREYRQKRDETFREVSELPSEEQAIRVFSSIIIFIPLLVWLLWYSEIMFLSCYLLMCYFLELPTQLQIPVLVRIIIIIASCADFGRSIMRVKHSHLKTSKLKELVIEPMIEPIRERIITERVLVICPFCGKKNEQGIGKCQNCGADL